MVGKKCHRQASTLVTKVSINRSQAHRHCMRFCNLCLQTFCILTLSHNNTLPRSPVDIHIMALPGNNNMSSLRTASTEFKYTVVADTLSHMPVRMLSVMLSGMLSGMLSVSSPSHADYSGDAAGTHLLASNMPMLQRLANVTVPSN